MCVCAWCGFMKISAPALKCKDADLVHASVVCLTASLNNENSPTVQYSRLCLLHVCKCRIGFGSAMLAALSCFAPVLAGPLHLHQH